MASIKTKLLTVAKKVSSRLSAIESINSIVLFGSVNQGICDDKSDIDLYVFCKPSLPSIEDRISALGDIISPKDRIESCNKDCWDTSGNSYDDKYNIDGTSVDAFYSTTQWLDKIIDGVKNKGNILLPEMKFRPYTILGLLDNCKVIFARDNFITNSINSIYPYPESLQMNIIESFYPTFKGSLEELINYAPRNIGNIAFLFHLNRFMDALDNILFAINKKYPHATKRCEHEYHKLQRKPHNLVRRIELILKGPFSKNNRIKLSYELKKIFEEFDEIIEENRPNLYTILQKK